MKKTLLLSFLALLITPLAMAQTNVTIDVTYYYNNSLTQGENYNVTYTNRTFYAGVWEFLCLPFDADKTTLDSAFGNDNYEVQQFAEITDGNNFHFAKMETPQMTAGYAYLIRVKTKVSSLTFPNVTVKLTADPLISADGALRHGTAAMGIKGCIFSHSWDVTNEGGSNYNYKQENGTLTLMDYKSPDLIATSAYLRSTDSSLKPRFTPEATEFSGVVINDDDPFFVKTANRVQLSNVPTIYIDIPDVANLDTDLTKDRSTGQADYHYATIKVIATDDTSSPHYLESFEEDVAQNMEIKVRGNSTADPSKRAYRLKFASKKTSSDGKAHKHDLLGRGYSKRNWVLLANAFDNSLIRNALTTELSTMVGMPFVPGYKFIDLVINGDYRGTYQVSDHCEVDADRINVDEDTGWYVEFQGRGDMLDQPVCFSSPTFLNVKNPEPEDETDEEALAEFLQPFKDYFSNVWMPSFNDDCFTDPVYGWRSANDEETWLKFLIVTEITGDYDGLMSVKAYREADGKLIPGPVWDKDLAYGNITCAKDNVLVPYIENGQVPRSQVQKMYRDPAFIKRMKETLDQMVSDGLLQTLCDKIDALGALVTETRALNYEKWGVTPPSGSMEVFYAWQDYAPYLQQLKDWLATRISKVQELINEKYDTYCTPSNFTYDVTVSATDDMCSSANKMVNVTMTNRSFTNGVWNALTLPFSPTLEQMKTAFGDDFELREFADVTEDGRKMVFLPVDNREVLAGMPYIIKPSKNVASTLSFNEVILRNPVVNYRTVNGATVTHGDYSFSGMTLAANVPTDGSAWLIGNDGTTLSTPASAMQNGSMAYVTMAEGAANPVIVFTEEEEETGEVVLLDLLSEKTPYTNDEDVVVSKLTYRREASAKTANHLQPWFVPFDYAITEEDTENITFYKVNMIAASGEGGEVEDVNAVYLYYKSVDPGDVLYANRPYFIKLKSVGIHDFVLEDVTLKARKSDAAVSTNTAQFNYDFYGTYDVFSPDDDEANQWLSLNVNGNLFWNKESSYVNPYRWYIWATPKDDDPYTNISFFLVEGEPDDGTTDIQSHASSREEMEGYYTVGGIKINKPIRGLNIVKYKDGSTDKLYIK